MNIADEAEKRFPDRRDGWPDIDRKRRREDFIAGAEWARQEALGEAEAAVAATDKGYSLHPDDRPYQKAKGQAIAAIHALRSDAAGDRTMNPDCRDGKHDACNGDAWDFQFDQPSECQCECHSRRTP